MLLCHLNYSLAPLFICAITTHTKKLISPHIETGPVERFKRFDDEVRIQTLTSGEWRIWPASTFITPLCCSHPSVYDLPLKPNYSSTKDESLHQRVKEKLWGNFKLSKSAGWMTLEGKEGRKEGRGWTTEKTRAASVDRVGKREMPLWCDGAHLSQPDSRNHPHCQSRGVSSGYNGNEGNVKDVWARAGETERENRRERESDNCNRGVWWCRETEVVCILV